MTIKNHLPNSLTLLNLFCGCCGIVACLYDQYQAVPVFIGIALLADFLDGFVARALKVKSDLGAQLDSLADMTTFGVLPGMMLFVLIRQAYTDIACTGYQGKYFPYIGFVYSIFACLRLAKFNIDTRQTVNFIGLNTPSGAMFVLGLYANLKFQVFQIPFLYSNTALLIIAVGLAFMLVSELEIFSMKGNPFSWKQNKWRVLFLISCVPQLIFLKWLGLTTCIVSYVLFALLHNATKQPESN